MLTDIALAAFVVLAVPVLFALVFLLGVVVEARSALSGSGHHPSEAEGGE